MSVRALRFVHAANLRLDAPLALAGAVGDDVRTILEEATATAFERVIATALEHDADALLITGNTFDAAAGSLSAEATLLRELRKLAENGLPVFITPGILDPPSAWREIPSLPDNVTVFLKGDEAGVELTDRGRPLATILPVSGRFGVDAPELERLRAPSSRPQERREFTIGLWLPDGAVDRSSSFGRFASLDYLAAGETALFTLTEGHVHVQASAQGLHAGETGWHGCQLVDVDAEGGIQSRLVPTAPVRWETCRIDGRGVVDRDELCERMLAQMELIPGYTGELVRIVTWPLDQTVMDGAGLHSDDDLQELQEMLVELNDPPQKGPRYAHRLETVWDDAKLPTAVDRELWQDFLRELDRWTPLEGDRLVRLWEQETGGATAPAGWPADVRWPPVSPERVRRLTLRNGRRWFRSTGGVSR
jgi:hypothetical protein